MPSNLESANRGAAEGWLDKARIARRRGDTRNALRLVDKSLALVEVEGAQAFRDSLELNNQPEGVPDNQPEGGQDMSFRDTIERWRRSAADKLPAWAVILPQYRKRLGFILIILAFVIFQKFILRPNTIYYTEDEEYDDDGSYGQYGLPGDIHYQSGPVTIFFPIVSCIVVSILFSMCRRG